MADLTEKEDFVEYKTEYDVYMMYEGNRKEYYNTFQTPDEAIKGGKSMLKNCDNALCFILYKKKIAMTYYLKILQKND